MRLSGHYPIDGTCQHTSRCIAPQSAMWNELAQQNAIPVRNVQAIAAAAKQQHQLPAACMPLQPCSTQQQQLPPPQAHLHRAKCWPIVSNYGRTTAAQPMHPNSTSSNNSLSNSSSTHHMLYQQLSASLMLEQAAAAPRPAGAPPEGMVASSSGSSSCCSSSSSSSSSRAAGTRSSSLRKITSHNAAAGTSSWGMSTLLGAADAADAAAATAAAALHHELQAAPANAFAKSRKSSSSSGGSSSSSSAGGNGRPDNGAAAVPGSSRPRLTEAGWELMQVIMYDCSTWQQLLDLVNTRSRDFTAQHCAAALFHVSNMWQRQQQQASGGQKKQQVLLRSELQQAYPQVLQLAEALLNGLQQQMAAAGPSDVADALYAMDKLGMLQDPSSDAAAAGSSSSVRSAATSIPGIPATYAGVVEALLQHSTMLMRQGRFQLRHVSRVCCSCAHMSLNPGSDWWATALEAAAEGMEQLLQQHQAAALAGFSLSSTASSHSSSSISDSKCCQDAQAVALIGWAVAKLQAPANKAWWGCLQATAAELLPCMAPNQLSTCIWALATARQTPSADWMAAFYAATGSCMHEFTGQGLANIMWSLAVLQQQPAAAWVTQFETSSSAQLPHMTLQHLSQILWALGQLHGSQPSRAAGLESLAGAGEAAGHLQHSRMPGAPVKGQQQQRQQQQLLSAAWLDQMWVQLARVELDAGAAQGVSCLLWGLVRLQVPVPRQRLKQLEGLASEVLRDASPQPLVVIVWALGSLRGRATNRTLLARLRRYCATQPTLLQQLPPEGLCMLLYGLSRMRAWQSEAFKQQLLAAVAARVPLQQQQQQQLSQSAELRLFESGSSLSSNGSAGKRPLSAASLPIVLMCLKQLHISVSTGVLQSTEAVLSQHVSSFPPKLLALTLFSLGAARSAPKPAFLTAVTCAIDTQLTSCSSRDVAHVLYGLAAVAGWDSNSRLLLMQPDQQVQLHRLMDRACEVLPDMDHGCLAMMLWSLARLQLRPSPALLQAALAATHQQLPSMGLLSITSILAALRDLEYLPPMAWMVEVCHAARTKVNIDTTPTAWQRRDCLRRFEQTVVWYNEAVQQQAAADSALSSRDEPSAEGTAGEEQQQQQQHEKQHRARMGMLAAANTSSEAMIAAAVGVAAAVAQQWHP